MEVRPGYKRTEVGVIPEDWEVKTLGELLNYEQPAKYLVKDTEYTNTGTPVLTAGKTFILGYTDEQEGIYGNLPVIVFDDFTTASRYVDFPFKVKSSAIKLLRAKNGEADLRFVSEKMQMLRFAVGDHKRYYISEYQHIETGIPPLPEQRAIAAVLSDADALITSLDRLIAKKRAIKQGAMQELLTGKTRLPGFSGEWSKKTLGEIAELKSGYAFRSSTYVDTGDFKIITIANVQDGYLDVKECKRISAIPSDLQPHQELRQGDCLISMTGNVGRVCCVDEDKCLLNQRVGKLIPTSANHAFFFQLIRQRQFIDSMMLKAKGGAQGNLSVSDIMEFEFCAPIAEEEQRAIAAVLSDIDAEIAALEARRDKTRALKQGMMQELLTGKTRLV